MSEKISYIKTNNSLKTIEKSHEIKRAVVDRIKNNIDVDALRSSGHINNELILFVCNVIEELCKKKYQINNKSLNRQACILRLSNFLHAKYPSLQNLPLYLYF